MENRAWDDLRDGGNDDASVAVRERQSAARRLGPAGEPFLVAAVPAGGGPGFTGAAAALLAPRRTRGPPPVVHQDYRA